MVNKQKKILKATKLIDKNDKKKLLQMLQNATKKQEKKQNGREINRKVAKNRHILTGI